MGQVARPGGRDGADAGPDRHRGRCAQPAAQAGPRRGSGGRGRGAGRRRHRGRLRRRGQVRPAAPGHVGRPVHPAGRDRARGRVRSRCTGRHRRPGGGDAGRCCRGDHADRCAALDLYARRSTPPDGSGSAPRSASTAMWRRRPSAAGARGPTCWWWTPRTGTRRRCSSALRAVRALHPGSRWSAGNVVTAAGDADLIEAGADIVKVGVGTWRHVHDPDDDRGRPSAVLRRAGMRGTAAAARRVRLGRRRGAPPTGRGARAGGRGRQRDDRIVVRRDLRVPRRPSARPTGGCTRRASGWRRPGRCRLRAASDSAFERARKELFEEGISSARMYLDPVRPGVEDLIDMIVAGLRSACTYAGARDLAEFGDRAVVGLQSASGYSEGMPVATSW